VRRASDNGATTGSGLIAVIDEHLVTAKRHAAGTTDWLLEALALS